MILHSFIPIDTAVLGSRLTRARKKTHTGNLPTADPVHDDPQSKSKRATLRFPISSATENGVLPRSSRE
jgi:hypothetical protein